jgi:hypothetical protein
MGNRCLDATGRTFNRPTHAATHLIGWMLTAITLSGTVAHAAEAVTCQGFKFEQVKEVSLQDLGRMTKQEVSTASSGSVTFIPFDEEDQPWKDGLFALGLVFASVGDLGEMPVGGYVWVSKNAGPVTHDASKSGKSVALTFRLDSDPRCAMSKLVFEIKPQGKVSVNGHSVGSVK